MSAPEPRPPRRSRRRDADLRTVSRTTRAIAALAVLGTVTFAGLASSATPGHSSATPTASTGTRQAAVAPATASPDPYGDASSTYDDGPSVYDDPADDGGAGPAAVAPRAPVSAPPSAPVPSVQPAVVSSGGS